MDPYRIVVADDHVVVRQGMKRIIEEMPGLEVSGEVGDGSQLMELLDGVCPDMILLDITMPNLNGFEATREIRKRWPVIKVLILTMHRRRDYMQHAFSAGAHGYLLKEDSDLELYSAIDTIKNGGIYVTQQLMGELTQDVSNLYHTANQTTDMLTSRERDVLKLVAEGKSSKEVAEILCISVRTVENHRANMMKKLNMNKTAQLINYAIQKGYAPIAP